MLECPIAECFGADQVGIVHFRPIEFGHRYTNRIGCTKIGLDRAALPCRRTDRIGVADPVGQQLVPPHHDLLAQQLRMLATQIGNIERLFHFHAQGRDFPGLLQIAVYLPLVDRFDHVLDLGICRGKDADNIGIAILGELEQFIAEGAWHALVRHENLDRIGVHFQHALALLDGVRRGHGRQGADRTLKILHRCRLIVDE